MPFVDIRLAGSATRAQKADIVADVTRSLVERLGKSPVAVQVVISEVSTENYGAGGLLVADRPTTAPRAQAEPMTATQAQAEEDAHAAVPPR
ncbi:MAG: 4-oxalocrotonate tautomerase family protein [Sphingobium sp.]